MKKPVWHNILWVDDDIRQLTPFVEEFQDEGYQVIRAMTPEEMETALAADGRGIDLIIMDLILPTGSSMSADETNFGQSTGQELIKRIKEDSAFCDIPLILFTISSDVRIAEWCRMNNINFLRKTEILPSELLKQVKSILPDEGNRET